MFINVVLLTICMTNNSFIDAMALDWAPSSVIFDKKKLNIKHQDDWHWFFKDSDFDGVMNGVDCQPYNRHKQDAFSYLKASTPSYFKIPTQQASSLPAGAIASGPNQNVCVAPPKVTTLQQPKQNICVARAQTPTNSSASRTSFSSTSNNASTAVPVPQVSKITAIPQKTVTSNVVITSKAPIVQTTKTVFTAPEEGYNYTTDSNRAYKINANNQLVDKNNIVVKPIYKKYDPVAKTGGGLTDFYRSDLSAAAGEAIQKGYNREAVENLYDTHPLYAGNDAKSIAAAAATNYLKKNNISVVDVNKSSTVSGKAGDYDGRNIITLYSTAAPDRNGLLIHETAHAMEKPLLNTSIANKINTVKNGTVVNVEPNISGNNIRGDYIKRYASLPLYKNISSIDKKKEDEAYYIMQYYNKQQPRNQLIDDFEKKLDINTSRILTPEQQTIYQNASNTLIKEAKDRNDMTTGVFEPKKKTLKDSFL